MTEQEALALVYAQTLFKTQTPFVCYINHEALQYLINKPVIRGGNPQMVDAFSRIRWVMVSYLRHAEHPSVSEQSNFISNYSQPFFFLPAASPTSLSATSLLVPKRKRIHLADDRLAYLTLWLDVFMYGWLGAGGFNRTKEEDHFLWDLKRIENKKNILLLLDVSEQTGGGYTLQAPIPTNRNNIHRG